MNICWDSFYITVINCNVNDICLLVTIAESAINRIALNVCNTESRMHLWLQCVWIRMDKKSPDMCMRVMKDFLILSPAISELY